MRVLKAIFTLLLLNASISVHAEFTLLAESEYGGQEEEEIVTKVPYRTFFSTRDVEISGTLRYPKLKEDSQSRKFPVIIYNHGSQDKWKAGYSTTSGELIVSLLVRKGFAVFTPARKGFSNNGVKRNDIDANVTEPINCQVSDLERGLNSALVDVHAFLKLLSEKNNLDMSRVIMAGHSRGGLLSLAYAAKYPASIIGVISFVPIWISEDCNSSYNYPKLEELAKTVNSLTLVFYANRDRYYDESHAKNFARILSGNKNIQAAVKEGHHSALKGDIDLWDTSLEIIFKGK
jgi:dipeptidyl aminopeptidase/acylaminoacyl peptidase